jgi:hypothetical protein
LRKIPVSRTGKFPSPLCSGHEKCEAMGKDFDETYSTYYRYDIHIIDLHVLRVSLVKYKLKVVCTFVHVSAEILI